MDAKYQSRDKVDVVDTGYCNSSSHANNSFPADSGQAGGGETRKSDFLYFNSEKCGCGDIV